MLFFQNVDVDTELTRTDPLYVGHFFDLKGMWWSVRKKRQQMIFRVAFTWYKLVKNQLKTPGMITEELILTGLTKEVRDARRIIEHFFTITRLGFNLGDGINKSPTIVSPKRLPKKYIDSIERISNQVIFNPGSPPTNKSLVKTTVHVIKSKAPLVRARLKKEEREDLLPVVNWLYEQSDPITFYYRSAGQLQARDTSVWPVRAIELWPGWLRTEMFGTTIDLENAFLQFILHHLKKKHSANTKLLELKYPDLMKAAYDKKEFREELCLTVLQRPPSEENIKIVKKLIMALANGSNASAKLMVSGADRCQAVRIVKQAAPDMLPTDLVKAGNRLQSIAKQFRNAKRELCIFLLKAPPSHKIQKQIFKMYFEWEKDARYKMWSMVGFTGISAHDGLDGIVISNPETFADKVFTEHGLRVKVDNYEMQDGLSRIISSTAV